MDLFWEKEGWQEHDKHLVELNGMPFRRAFPSIPAENGLYIVRGPRQVGKSSFLKTVLDHYCQSMKCFYLSLEEVEHFKELSEILRSVAKRQVILLDEINYVKDWDRAIKHFVDTYPDHLLIITGSHAYDLKMGADRMPGRFGKGDEIQLLPMGFQEFKQMRRQAGWEAESHLSELRQYFRVGGFPRAVAEAGKDGRPKQALKTYWRWLSGDVVRLGKQELYLKEILGQLAKTVQTPLSFQTLAKRTSIGSHNTVREYIEILEACFALKMLFAIDHNSGAYSYRKNKKFYFTDPLIYQIALEQNDLKQPEDFEARLAEMVAHEELSRSYTKLGYFAGRSGEVDFVSYKNWALEVKWSPIASNLSKAYMNYIAPWKRVWTQENMLLDLPPKDEQ